jgi:membrane associated rhomboid family serine protease
LGEERATPPHSDFFRKTASRIYKRRNVDYSPLQSRMRPSRQMQTATRPWPVGKPSITALLIAVTVAASVAQWMFDILDRGEAVKQSIALWDVLGLTPEGIRQGHYWQFLTFGMLHAGPFPLHFLGDILVLYFAGRETEPIIGRRHFLILFLVGNLLGGAAQWAAMTIGFAPPEAPLVGISAGVAAVLGAYATILPEWELAVFSLFGLRLSLRTKMLGLAGLTAAALLWAEKLAPAIGPVGIFTGIITGWAYVKALGFGNPLAIQRFLYRKRLHEARIERMPPEQFIVEEIDPILDKIARTGMQGLTRRERKTLEKGRAKIAAAAARGDLPG